jgi:hypothetical protein
VGRTWQPDKLLALARKTFDYQWSLEDETNPPLESKDDYLGLHHAALSVSWKLGLAQYHASQAITAIPRVVRNAPDKATAAGVLMMTSMSGHKEAEAFEAAMLIAEAHTIAAAQALHSVMDIFANVVYIALRLNAVKSIPERRRSLYTVAEILKDDKLGAMLSSVLNSAEFRYLSAYVNTTKHRRLLSHRFTIEIKKPQKFGLRFRPFKYEFKKGDAQIFPNKWMDDFVRESLFFVSDAVARMGRAVERSLSAKAIAAPSVSSAAAAK